MLTAEGRELMFVHYLIGEAEDASQGRLVVVHDELQNYSMTILDHMGNGESTDNAQAIDDKRGWRFM